MVANQPILEIDHLSVRFGRQKVLRDIVLNVPRGERLAIIGESGCGKTVLLKTIIGLVRPTGGEVRFDGRRIDTLSEAELARERARFGFVFQNAALFDSMTIEENIAFPLRHHRRGGLEAFRAEVESGLAAVGLPLSVLRKHPAELSGGMRKRVGLARALVMQPEVLLYDEPTTGLDPIMSDVINELMLRSGRGEGVTSILVTHDMKTAHKVADRVVMLYPIARLEGAEPQVLFEGKPDAIDAAKDRRVAQFVRGEAGDRMMEMGEQAVV